MYRIIGGDGREYGPVSAEQLRQWMAEGRVNAQTRAVAEGSTQWQLLGQFPEFAGTAPIGVQTAPPPISPPQPPWASFPQVRPYVPAYLPQAILCTLFCCMPFGVVAIVFAAQVNSKLAAGDVAGAMQSSRQAKGWCWAALASWLAIVVIYLFGFIVLAAMHRHHHPPYWVR